MHLLNLILDICRLRRGPQDVPYSPALLAGTAAACVALQLIIAAMRSAPLGEVLGGSLLSVVFLFIVLHAMLTVRGLRGRFVQSATALLLCAFFFNVLSLPVALLVGEPPATPEQMSPVQLLLGLIAMPLLIWKVVVDAHVLRHSLNLPFFGGLALAMAWIVALLILIKLTGVAAG